MCAMATREALHGAAKGLVVVMDDDQLCRMLVRTILTGYGYAVSIADNGASGMELVRRHGADIVITDLFMPEQDGLQTILQLKREFPRVRVLAMTAGTSFLTLETARDTATLIGADAFLEKPLDHDGLLAAVRSLVPAAPAGHEGVGEPRADR